MSSDSFKRCRVASLRGSLRLLLRWLLPPLLFQPAFKEETHDTSRWRGFHLSRCPLKSSGDPKSTALSFFPFFRPFCLRPDCCWGSAAAFRLLGLQPRCLAVLAGGHPSFGQMRLPRESSRLPPPWLFVSSRTSSFLSSSCFLSAHGRESKRCAGLNRARTMPETSIVSTR